MIEDINITVAKTAERVESLMDRVEKLDARVSNVEDLAVSVRELAISIEQNTKSVEKVEKKVDNLLAEPASAWKNFKWMVIGVIVTAGLGGVVASVIALVLK